MPPLNFSLILPLLTLTVWACLLLLVDLFVKRKWITALLAAVGLAGSLGLTISQVGSSGAGFNNMVVLDGFSIFVDALLLVAGLFGVALAYSYLKRMGLERGEYYTLLLFSIAGMMLMAQAADLIIVFLALEMLSIPLYVLSAFARPRLESEEAGLKYFLLGAFSTGFRGLWDCLGLRCRRFDFVERHCHRCILRGCQRSSVDDWFGSDPGWAWLQGGGRSVPHVDS